MEGFGLILGHLLGDYVCQNDWQATNKTNPHPGSEPGVYYRSDGGIVVSPETPALLVERLAWRDARRKWWIGHLACTVHCLLCTLAVWATSFWWMPAWGLAVVFLAHWPVDRWRLAGRWMRNVSGQRSFATGPMSPWSVIVVDNVFHLLVLFLIGAAVLVRTSPNG